MKIGTLTVPFASQPLKDVLPYLHGLGVKAVELGTSRVTNSAHCNPDVFLGNPDKIKELKQLLEENGMVISALSCHGNPIHPDKKIAAADHKAFVDTVALAQELGVDTIVTFSGCPGDSDGSHYPNWVTCPWPEDFMKVLDYQWNEKLVPYWKEAAAIAKRAGVKVAIEMHPGFCVYNTESLLKLRDAVGEEIGANLDPSHLIWQGMDPVAVIKKLGDAIFHFHAKDTKIDKYNTAVNGVLDTKHYSDEMHRSWIFRSVGYGNDLLYWKDIISALRLVGYDYAISIEHEDSLMSQNEGLSKAVDFLKQVITVENVGDMWWA